MASRRVHLGGLVAIAATLAALVAGCGGDSSSAPGTTSAVADTTAAPASAGAGSATGQGAAGSDAKQTKSGGEKKNPPLKLPTGPPEKGPTPAQEAQVPIADIALSVPAGLAKENTCEGKDISPEVSWRNVPPGTKELALLVANLQPVNGKLHFDWAIAGIDPTLQGLKADEVPDGAVLGKNGDGGNKYSICPRGPEPEIYAFSLYAIGKGLDPKKGFDPLDFRKQLTKEAESVGIAAVPYGP